jgi:hypothetical protein
MLNHGVEFYSDMIQKRGHVQRQPFLECQLSKEWVHLTCGRILARTGPAMGHVH